MLKQKEPQNPAMLLNNWNIAVLSSGRTYPSTAAIRDQEISCVTKMTIFVTTEDDFYTKRCLKISRQ